MSSTPIGEPISGGQAPRGWDELSIRFDDGMDLGNVQMAQIAKRFGYSLDELRKL